MINGIIESALYVHDLPRAVVFYREVLGLELMNHDDRFAAFNGTALFKDDVQSYPTVEPAIDLTATSPLAFARQASGVF